MMSKNNIVKSNYKDILVFLYIIVMQINFMLPTSIFNTQSLNIIYKLLTFGVVNLIGFYLLLDWLLEFKSKTIILLLGLFIVTGVMCSYYTKNEDVLYYVTSIRFLGVALYLYQNKLNYKTMAVMMGISVILFSPLLLMDLGSNVLEKASRNYSSILLMLSSFIYALSYWKNNKKVPLGLIIIAWFIVIFSRGRGGRLTFPILLLGIVFKNIEIIFQNKGDVRLSDIINYFSKNVSYYIKILILLVIGFTFIFVKKQEYLKNQQIFQEEIKKTKSNSLTKEEGLDTDSKDKNKTILEQGKENEHPKNNTSNDIKDIIKDKEKEALKLGDREDFTSAARINIIKIYFNKLNENPIRIITGVENNSDPIFIRYKENFHNSYLQLHSSFGIVGFLVMGYFGLVTFFKLVFEKKYGDLLIYISILLRIFTDKAALMGHLDVILLFYFLLLLFNNDNTKLKDKKCEI